MQDDCSLQEILEAASNVLYCQERGRKRETDFDLGAILGEVDWACEIHRIYKESRMLTMSERSKQFKGLQERMFEVQEAKGKDYGEEKDGLRNLRRRGVQGVVARMGDKMMRLENLTQPGRTVAVADESIDDTLIDLANYCLLLIILRTDLKKEEKQVQGHL